MDSFILQATIFFILNVLDLVSTWLGLYALPPELRAKEGNPLFKFIEKNFAMGVAVKMIFTLICIAMFLIGKIASTEPIEYYMLALNIVLMWVVTHNLTIYTLRRVYKKKVPTVLKIMTNVLTKLRVPAKVANPLAYFLTIGILMQASLLYVGVIYVR